jgi:hypothetical protein
MAGRRVLRIGAEGGAVGPGEGTASAGARGRGRVPAGFPRVSYFFGKTPVWPVPPQKTLVPTRSF